MNPSAMAFTMNSRQKMTRNTVSDQYSTSFSMSLSYLGDSSVSVSDDTTMHSIMTRSNQGLFTSLSKNNRNRLVGPNTMSVLSLRTARTQAPVIPLVIMLCQQRWRQPGDMRRFRELRTNERTLPANASLALRPRRRRDEDGSASPSPATGLAAGAYAFATSSTPSVSIGDSNT